MFNDTVSDMLTRLRNAILAKHQVVEIPFTKMNRNIAKILFEEGFIQKVEDIGETVNMQMLVSLKYRGKYSQSVIHSLQRISKPGLRVYANTKELPKVLGGLGIAVISTSRGLMTDSNARIQGLGGEVLCYIW